MKSLVSFWNSIKFFFRRLVKWQRGGYGEFTSEEPIFHPLAKTINDKYKFSSLGKKLSPPHWHRNLATLWYFEQMLSEISFKQPVNVSEPCCQNFARLPAIDAYMTHRGWMGRVVGVEIDAFVPVKNFYSLWDHAQYFRGLVQRDSDFLAENYFTMTNPTDLILCFYPFVSVEPALAWGLPAKYSGAELWVETFLRNLKPQGYLFVVHQGIWEQEEFDKSRKDRQLELLKREELKCPFFSTKHPAMASLYQKR